MKKVIVPLNQSLSFFPSHTLEIEIYKWANTAYHPKVEIDLCHNNERLKLKIIAYENEVTIKEYADNGRIWCDSCVEFFMKPYTDDARYINFEINPIGAMIMSIGEGRESRKPLVFEYKESLNMITHQNANNWTAQFEIPFTMLSQIFENKKILGSGDTIKGNFYKCGDETPSQHFGMWNEIEGSVVSFHLPDYFGELYLE